MNDTLLKCSDCGVKNRIPLNKLHLKPKCGRCGHVLDPASEGQVIELDDTSFDQVIGNSSVIVLVDFYSPTCGPCQVLAPVVSALAGKYGGRAVIAKYDTSRFHTAAARFQIRGVPTLIFFKNGQVVDQVVGAVPQADIEQKLNHFI